MIPFHALQGVFQSPALQAAAWGMAASFVLCVLLGITKRWHGALKMSTCRPKSGKPMPTSPKAHVPAVW